jgi:hypothetical protein
MWGDVQRRSNSPARRRRLCAVHWCRPQGSSRSVDLSEAWHGRGATLGGRAEAAYGEVAVVVGNGAVEGFSGCQL